MSGRRVLSQCFCIVLVFQLASMASVSIDSPNVIDEVMKALASHSDMSMVANYLKLSKDDLTASLTSNGKTSGFTFFAPKNWAFIRMLPQDVADPFYVDSELRKSVLLHHFAKQSLSPADLTASTEIIMADEKPSKLTRALVKTGLGTINEAKIEGQPIALPGSLGNVYIVDGVFTTRDVIEKSLQKHPAKETPWGPIETDTEHAEDTESQTVVVDLLAEFFADEVKVEAN